MNKFIPHIFVIPEDEADREIADGFVNNQRVDDRRIQVMPVARGWPNVLTTFQDEYIPRLRKYPLGHVVMLVDFDDRGNDRMARFRQVIPDDLGGRVFVVGSSMNPEALKDALKLSAEKIGWQLAEDCAQGVPVSGNTNSCSTTPRNVSVWQRPSGRSSFSSPHSQAE
ncbi:MAG: hypothetical protein ACYC61_15095 [Isosphaeraceae bacterium]